MKMAEPDDEPDHFTPEFLHLVADKLRPSDIIDYLDTLPGDVVEKILSLEKRDVKQANNLLLQEIIDAPEDDYEGLCNRFLFALQEEDPCLARPCAHNSKCTTINETSYDCDCPGGWGGIDCEIDINECAPGPNKADCGFGDCHNLPGSFLCDCHSGFTGPFCSINVDECASNPCLNGGVCKDGIDMYTCDCTNGFAGDHCEININECDSDPCLNGGICLDDVDDYYCVCNPGYTGKSCEQDIDECSNNPCVHGQCVNENGTFHCECDNLLIKGRLCEDAPSRDCGDLKAFWNLNKNSVYTVKKPGKQLTLARCDMNTDEGGWTVFQKRVDGVVNFDRKWDDYKTGFGNLGSSFWWGTERLYTVTAGRSNLTLRIDLEDFENNTAYAEYDNFSVGPESDNYRIHVGGYRGNAGDAFNFYWAAFSHNDMAFSTKDRDNDKFRTNCALLYHGGWWYNGCWSANLNGIYYDSPVYNATVHDGVEYYPWKQTKYSLKRVEMKFRDASIIQSNMTAPFV